MIELFVWFTLAGGTLDDGIWVEGARFKTMAECQQELASLQAKGGIFACGLEQPSWEPHTVIYLNSLKTTHRAASAPH